MQDGMKAELRVGAGGVGSGAEPCGNEQGLMSELPLIRARGRR